ncbi:MAG: hypothetical protein HY785_17235 [Oscillatoriophycideae cyanobacterium NC_groundwater_1537_Pr4_S-0.65um_50_18]|nr:hypothetical protein [Oscillatoriophycideae cyanobacterium NC_groundwater_1537_Pr4_S-0.65um_50_18]
MEFIAPVGVSPVLLDHKPYQQRLPTEDELKLCFTHPDTGIATMGGWNNTLWIDIDAKHRKF